MKSRLFEQLQFRSIALTGRVIGDLDEANVLRFVGALTETELVFLLKRSHQATGTNTISQDDVQAASRSQSAWKSLCDAIDAGAKVEPGPLTAYLRRNGSLVIRCRSRQRRGRR
jgi:hypothetical protein